MTWGVYYGHFNNWDNTKMEENNKGEGKGVGERDNKEDGSWVY